MKRLFALALLCAPIAARAHECTSSLKDFEEAAVAPVAQLTDGQRKAVIFATAPESRKVHLLGDIKQAWWTFVVNDDDEKTVDKTEVVVVGFDADDCYVSNVHLSTDKFLSITQGDPS
jgi:hypothetical protein